MNDESARTQRNESKMNPNLWVLLQTEQTLEELVKRFTPEFTIDPSEEEETDGRGNRVASEKQSGSHMGFRGEIREF